LAGPSLYLINAVWPDSECQKWKAFQAANDPAPALEYIGTAAYTEEEKKWVKTHYGNEYQFLLLHGLKIASEEDREEGRAIARSFIEEDKQADLSASKTTSIMGKDEKDYEEEDGDDSDWDPEGHMTDYLFNPAELRFIEKHWKNSETFLYTHGFKFYDTDDCNAAKHLIKNIMHVK
jgi:hypothetical protein